jgi:hypothetical protein
MLFRVGTLLQGGVTGDQVATNDESLADRVPSVTEDTAILGRRRIKVGPAAHCVQIVDFRCDDCFEFHRVTKHDVSLLLSVTLSGFALMP